MDPGQQARFAEQPYACKFDEEFFGELPILTFPAGLCSRCIGGEVTDLPRKTNFLKKAYASQRQIVPVFVEGRLRTSFTASTVSAGCWA